LHCGGDFRRIRRGRLNLIVRDLVLGEESPAVAVPAVKFAVIIVIVIKTLVAVIIAVETPVAVIIVVAVVSAVLIVRTVL
jgi:hypothetical protein